MEAEVKLDFAALVDRTAPVAAPISSCHGARNRWSVDEHAVRGIHEAVDAVVAAVRHWVGAAWIEVIAGGGQHSITALSQCLFRSGQGTNRYGCLADIQKADFAGDSCCRAVKHNRNHDTRKCFG
jgi:hypothetical protein